MSEGLLSVLEWTWRAKYADVLSSRRAAAEMFGSKSEWGPADCTWISPRCSLSEGCCSRC
jgi:hypothetical protein